MRTAVSEYIKAYELQPSNGIVQNKTTTKNINKTPHKLNP